MSTDSTKEAMRFLLSDERIAEVMSREFIEGFYDYKVACGSARAIRNIYEAARQQDKARIEELTGLVQELVNAIEESRVELCSAIPHLPGVGVKLATAQERACRAVLSKAKQRDFTPSTQ